MSLELYIGRVAINRSFAYRGNVYETNAGQRKIVYDSVTRSTWVILVRDAKKQFGNNITPLREEPEINGEKKLGHYGYVPLDDIHFNYLENRLAGRKNNKPTSSPTRIKGFKLL